MISFTTGTKVPRRASSMNSSNVVCFIVAFCNRRCARAPPQRVRPAAAGRSRSRTAVRPARRASRGRRSSAHPALRRALHQLGRVRVVHQVVDEPPVERPVERRAGHRARCRPASRSRADPRSPARRPRDGRPRQSARATPCAASVPPRRDRDVRTFAAQREADAARRAAGAEDRPRARPRSAGPVRAAARGNPSASVFDADPASARWIAIVFTAPAAAAAGATSSSSGMTSSA